MFMPFQNGYKHTIAQRASSNSKTVRSVCVLITVGLGMPLVHAQPSVSGNVISVPAHDWYQVQSSSSYESFCQGLTRCTVPDGNYIVINHTTGERFTDITVNNSSLLANDITVNGSTIQWLDNGWYQVQSEADNRSICEGGSSCMVADGSYRVINHTTGERFTGIVVGGNEPDEPAPVVGVTLEGNTLRWPGNDWYQVQDASNYYSVCEGGNSCEVQPGSYHIINLTSGVRIDNFKVENPDTTPGAGQVNNPVITDPLIKNRIHVTFDITVPAYQSDELSVELLWGDMNLTAGWVGDEYWSVSGELPINTEALLTIIFYDRNGNIELARFSDLIRTGSNTTESIQISADQFDTSQFDEDEDGVSNLDELVSGTDPLAVEESQLEILDSFSLSNFSTSRMSVSTSFEGKLSDERPYFDSFERFPVPGGYPGTQSSNVDIDAKGNGTLNYHETLQGAIRELAGTRTNTGSAVTWEGAIFRYDGQDNGHNVSFTNTVTVVDETTRSFVEEIVGSNGGTYQYGWDISSNLTGRLIEGTSLCEPVAGTVSETYRENYSRYPVVSTTVTTVSKEIGDPYWRVESVSADNETNDYFVRELIIFRPAGAASREIAPENKYFICDFVEF